MASRLDLVVVNKNDEDVLDAFTTGNHAKLEKQLVFVLRKFGESFAWHYGEIETIDKRYMASIKYFDPIPQTESLKLAIEFFNGDVTEEKELKCA